MNSRDTELMKRYIYQVVHRLPAAQRNDVGLELQELISDMAEESGSMEDVLMKLGDPAELAKKYQDTSHHLIGPEYYDTYLWFLKIVLLCSMIPVLAVSIFEVVKDGSFSAAVDIVPNCLTAGLGAFGGITLMFAFMERQKVAFDLRNQRKWSVNDLGDNFSGGGKAWSPANLAPLPHKKALISKGDSIVSIVFIVLFCVLMIFAPHFFSALPMGEEVAPLFNMDRWHLLLPLLILAMLICLMDEVIRLVYGRYCIPVMVSGIVCGGLQILIGFILMPVLHFLNPDFILQIQTHLGKEVNDFGDFLARIDGSTLNNVFFLFICFVTLIEIGVTVYKTMRYGCESEEGNTAPVP